MFHSVTPGQQGTDSIMPLPGRLGRGICQPSATTVHPLWVSWWQGSRQCHCDLWLQPIQWLASTQGIMAGTLPECEDGESGMSSPEMQDCRQKMPAQQKGLLLRSKLGRDQGGPGSPHTKVQRFQRQGAGKWWWTVAWRKPSPEHIRTDLISEWTNALIIKNNVAITRHCLDGCDCYCYSLSI